MRVLLVYLAWMCSSVGLFKKKGTTRIVDYTNLEDMKCAIKKLDGSEFRNAFDRQYVCVGQGHGEKSTLEMVRCTNMEKARQGKAGILLWMRRPITRAIRDGCRGHPLDIALFGCSSRYKFLFSSECTGYISYI
ncbi:hypothetical protein ACFX2B_001665 [Malus domestica]